jgi:hypothetical protein
MAQKRFIILVIGCFVALILGLVVIFFLSGKFTSLFESGNKSDISGNPSANTNGNTETQSSATPQNISTPFKVLIVGDSLILEGFGPMLEKTLLEHEGVDVVREGAYSTGLNKTDFFDWNQKTEELITLHKPDVLIVMFGANDGQGILDADGKAHPLGTEGWSEVYGRRVDAYLKRISPKIKKLFWVGHPIPGNAKFRSKLAAMNLVYQSETAKFPNAVYVNTWDRFAVNGEFKASIADDRGLVKRVKGGDGVHVTNFGGKIMADVVIKEMQPYVDIK